MFPDVTLFYTVCRRRLGVLKREDWIQYLLRTVTLGLVCSFLICNIWKLIICLTDLLFCLFISSALKGLVVKIATPENLSVLFKIMLEFRFKI